MIIKDKDAIERLNSPINLINRLRQSKTPRSGAMSLFGIGKKEVSSAELLSGSAITGETHPVENTHIAFNPFKTKEEFPQSQTSPETSTTTALIPSQTPTTLDNILEDHENQIKLGLAHDRALELLNDSVAMLATKLDDIKADKLPSVISAASKTVESIRKERRENRANDKEREVHYHFYTPQQKKIEQYEIIDVAS